jgi:hypothetical protein
MAHGRKLHGSNVWLARTFTGLLGGIQQFGIVCQDLALKIIWIDKVFNQVIWSKEKVKEIVWSHLLTNMPH